ncbi:MAG: MazG nucleotide pyrophosphohydrolase domain-containing protein [Sulfobacillus sp.]
MGQWVWDANHESRGFVVKGPASGSDIWAAFGALFPLDSPIRWWPSIEGPALDIQWGDLATMTLGPDAQVELPGSPDNVGPLIHVMERLLGDEGCPWDRQQTSQSLLRYLLDESYEAAEALVAHDMDAFQAELGDVLLQVVFHSALLSDTQLQHVATLEVDKLVRRHPHVFGQVRVANAEAVKDQWENLKAEEVHPDSQASWVYPSLVMAKRLGKTGMIPKTPVFQAVLDFMQVYIANDAGTLEDILADAAWAIAEVGRQHHLDAEWALWRRLLSLNLPSGEV